VGLCTACIAAQHSTLISGHAPPITHHTHRSCKLCADDKRGIVVGGEYGLTQSQFDAGFNVATLMSRYVRGTDWRDRAHWSCNDNVHPSRAGTYGGISFHPYETVRGWGRGVFGVGEGCENIKRPHCAPCLLASGVALTSHPRNPPTACAARCLSSRAGTWRTPTPTATASGRCSTCWVEPGQRGSSMRSSTGASCAPPACGRHRVCSGRRLSLSPNLCL